MGEPQCRFLWKGSLVLAHTLQILVLLDQSYLPPFSPGVSWISLILLVAGGTWPQTFVAPEYSTIIKGFPQLICHWQLPLPSERLDPTKIPRIDRKLKNIQVLANAISPATIPVRINVIIFCISIITQVPVSINHSCFVIKLILW